MIFLNWYKTSSSLHVGYGQLNSQIRDILCKNNIIGSIGIKKSGKSTFVKLISNQNVPTSAMDATTFATAYSICENNNLIYNNTIIIDYPLFREFVLKKTPY